MAKVDDHESSQRKDRKEVNSLSDDVCEKMKRIW